MAWLLFKNWGTREYIVELGNESGSPIKEECILCGALVRYILEAEEADVLLKSTQLRLRELQGQFVGRLRSIVELLLHLHLCVYLRIFMCIYDIWVSLFSVCV